MCKDKTVERGKQEANRCPVTVEDIKKMDYSGGGYFRMKGNGPQKIIHGPELQRILLEEIERLSNGM